MNLYALTGRDGTQVYALAKTAWGAIAIAFPMPKGTGSWFSANGSEVWLIGECVDAPFREEKVFENCSELMPWAEGLIQCAQGRNDKSCKHYFLCHKTPADASIYCEFCCKNSECRKARRQANKFWYTPCSLTWDQYDEAMGKAKKEEEEC